MTRGILRSAPGIAVLFLAASGACDRSLMGVADVDMEALNAFAGPTVAARSVASDLITIATRLQAGADAVPDVTLPTLARLFDRAIAAEAEHRGAEPALELRARHAALLDSAWSHIENGGTAEGERLLAAARGYQASTAARILGEATSTAYVFLVGRTLERVDRELSALGRGGRDVRQLRRMAASARDLQADARSALGRGEAGPALDIGAHAADLANSLVRGVRAH